jgi:hypothetical protein
MDEEIDRAVIEFPELPVVALVRPGASQSSRELLLHLAQ